MTEIFLSYDSSDRDRARTLRDALVAQGFDVHGDQEAPPGVEWEAWVRRRLAQSKCVVLLRSAASAHSNRMRHVAAVAEERGKLIVVRLDARSILQTLAEGPAHGQGQGPSGTGAELDLSGWSGDPEHPGWQELCRRIESRLRSSLWVQRLIQDIEAERARWRAQYEVSAARCKALNDELAQERSERAAAQDKVAGLEAQLAADAKARLRLQTRVMDLEQRLAGVEGRHADARLLLGEELRQKSAQLAEIETALTREQEEATRLRAELADVDSARRELTSRVAGHEAALGARDAHIADIEARLDRRDADIEELRAAVADRDQEVASLRASLAQRDADVSALQAGISERDRYTAELQVSVSQRDTYIARLTASLAERRACMIDLEASIAQRDTHIADLKTTLAELERRIHGRMGNGASMPAAASAVT